MKWLANTADQPCRLWYPDLVALPDEALMRQLAAGNHDALAVIFDRYQRLVLKVAMQVLRDPAEAEDLLQSVFLEILEAAGKFDASKGTLRVWVLQYVYHRGFNRRRYLNLRGMYEPAERTTPPEIDGTAKSDSPAGAVESARLVQQGLAHLSRAQRQTLEFAFYDGLTMYEIAERTGGSFASTRHHYYRGLEKLRSVLGKRATERSRSGASGEETAYVQS